MRENKHLTPVYIVYAAGKRLDLEHEGALQSITVNDRLNGVSDFSIVFDTAEVKVANKDIISLASELSIHLGYKDDVQEVFCGDVTALCGIRSESGGEQLRASGKNVLHRLQHNACFRGFEGKTPSGVIKAVIDNYSLKAQVDDFGAVKPLQTEEDLTDYAYLMEQAQTYGKQVYADGKTIYVKDEISVRSDEIIYEWGKSLVSIEMVQNMGGLISGVDYVGWDHLAPGSFAGSVELKDLPVKIGGSRSWVDVIKGGKGKLVEARIDLNSKDSDEAKQLAAGKLQTNSYNFAGALKGRAEGNCKLRPGMRVMIKMVGELFEGEYMAQAVTHRFDRRNGYTVEFALKRNMCP